MLLHKLYPEPLDLFETVKFKNGVNFIFAKKDKDSDTKKSLNGVGKSLLLNFLDYALLSSTTSHIRSAKENNDISKYSIVLEFKIEKKLFTLKRSLKEENVISVEPEKESAIKFESTKEAKQYLCDLIFKNEKYEGNYYNTWLRKLIPFFIKKQSSRKRLEFSDPVRYISEPPETELISYHLFLMGIKNSLFWKNFQINLDLKRKIPALREVKEFITDTYGLKKISQAENQIDKLKNEVGQYEKNIEKFQLADQYKNIEEESNQLTTKIKDLWYKNHLDAKKIESYKESYRLGDSIKTKKIMNLYSELNELLASNIKKTLDDAIAFRKNIADSRKEFLSSEIKNTKAVMQNRENELKKLESERAKLFKFLEAKEAIKDLSEAYLDLSRKTTKLNDLEGRIKTYRDLESEVTERKAEITNLYVEITTFIKDIKPEISDFRNVFFNVHDSIYPENKNGNSGFTFEADDGKDSKVNMNIYLPAGLSKGKNKARTLIYDLSILLNGIYKNINMPRFLVHDGIFDGMDKAHFISLYEYLEEKSKEQPFQYILTVNQEGTLSEEFGNADKVNPEKMGEEAIITLTPSKKLLGADWD